MAEDTSQPTQVMPMGGVAADRTMVAGIAAPGATQMGGSLACPVCQTVNSTLETYCSECGFLLASTPGAAESEPTDGTGMPELVETKSGRRFRLHPGSNSVGRESADVMLMDSTVSRRHAELTVEGAIVTVTDLGSTNGTSVDSARLAPNEAQEIAPGAVLQFGNAMLALVDPGGEPPTAAEATAVVAAPGGAEATIVGAPMEGAGSPPAGASGQAEPPAGAVAHLVAAGGAATGLYLLAGTTSIGRRSGNTVVLAADAYISGRHAEISCDQDGCSLTDLGSTNGTLVNGQRLEPGARHPLASGDEIQMGQGTWRFEPVPGGDGAASTADAPASDEMGTAEAHDAQLPAAESEEP